MPGGLFAVAIVVMAGARVPAAEPTLAEVLLRAAEYAREFQDRFASMIGDERYEQQVVARIQGRPSATLTVVRQRRLESETDAPSSTAMSAVRAS